MQIDLILMYIAVVYFMGCADRVSGDTYNLGFTKNEDRAFYGWLVACLFSHYWDWIMLATVLATIVGRAPGWGEPMGAALTGKDMNQNELEWYQVGILKRNAWLALLARGALWGACYIPIVYFDSRYMYAVLAFTIALPVAAFVSKITLYGNWETQERYRGGLAGVFISAMLVNTN